MSDFWIFMVCVCMIGVGYKVDKVASSIDNIDLFPSCELIKEKGMGSVFDLQPCKIVR